MAPEFLLAEEVLPFANLLFALAALEFAVDDEPLVLVRRGGRRRRGAFAFVVFGRELRKAPRTSSSCCALTMTRPPTNSANAKSVIEIFGIIFKLLQANAGRYARSNQLEICKLKLATALLVAGALISKLRFD
jgi:hypothetical protein